MRTLILVTTTVLVLVAGATGSARAFEHKASYASGHGGALHTVGMRRHAAKLVNRSAGVRRSAIRHEGDPDVRGGFIDLGPLGITAACGSYRSKHYCGQGYSVSGWTY